VGVRVTTLAQVRDGLFTRLGTIDDLRVYDHLPGDILPPAAVVLPPVVPDYRDDLGTGGLTATFAVLLLVTANLARQQHQLYELLERTGPRSVFEAIEDDRTLGGLNVDAHVVGIDDFDLSQFGLTNYYARAVNISVFAGG